MNIGKLVLSLANSIEEVPRIQRELEKLPKDYKPFRSLPEQIPTGVLSTNLGETISLSPIMQGVYKNEINIPDGANNIVVESIRDIKESEDKEPPIVIGATFKFDTRRYVIYRTATKHRNP